MSTIKDYVNITKIRAPKPLPKPKKKNDYESPYSIPYASGMNVQPPEVPSSDTIPVYIDFDPTPRDKKAIIESERSVIVELPTKQKTNLIMATQRLVRRQTAVLVLLVLVFLLLLFVAALVVCEHMNVYILDA